MRIINFNNVTLQILTVVEITTIVVESYNAVRSVVEDERVSSVCLLDDPVSVKGVNYVILLATNAAGGILKAVIIKSCQPMCLIPSENMTVKNLDVAELVVFTY